jgi:PIN domain nuclease of toxin-antitoxin system
VSRGFLLDTHALLWWVHQPAHLSAGARDMLIGAETAVFVSAVNAMEIAIKCRLGKMEFETELASHFVEQMEQEAFEILPVTAAHAQLAGGFPQPHRDPWDRLLAAQAQIEDLELVSCDPAVEAFGVPIFW